MYFNFTRFCFSVPLWSPTLTNLQLLAGFSLSILSTCPNYLSLVWCKISFILAIPTLFRNSSDDFLSLRLTWHITLWFKKVEVAVRIRTKLAYLEKSHQRNSIQPMLAWKQMQNENDADNDHDHDYVNIWIYEYMNSHGDHEVTSVNISSRSQRPILTKALLIGKAPSWGLKKHIMKNTRKTKYLKNINNRYKNSNKKVPS